MPGIESGSWLGAGKAKSPNIGVLDNEVWLGKADAAKLLKTSPRQLERRAQQGVIAKRYLPKRFGEKSARVVFSRTDIENVLQGNVELDVTERAITWIGRPEAAALLGVPVAKFDNKVRAGFIEKRKGDHGPEFSAADVLALKAGRPIRVKTRDATEVSRLRVPPPQSPRLARIPSPEFDVLRAFLAEVRGPAPAPKPWLTLSEAAEYSGLPAAWLVAQARVGAIRAVNVGTGAREFWRFNREGLGK